MRRPSLLPVCLVAAVSLVAGPTIAAASAPATPVAKGGSWQILTPTNTGIPGDYVYSVAVDNKDRPWVTADDPIWDEGGLGIKRGSTWKQWTNVDGKAPTHAMRNLTFDAQGTAWMASDVGLLSYRKGKVRTIWSRSNAPWPTSSVRDFDWDSNGNLWVALSQVSTVWGGVARYDGKKWKVWTSENGLPWESGWDQVSSLEIDDDDNVWIGSPVMGGAMYDGTAWSALGNGVGSWVYDIAIAPDGTPWYGFISQGVMTWDGSGWVDRTGPFGTMDISLVEIDNEGRVWIGTFIGRIWRWSGSGASWDLSYEPPSLGHVYGLDFTATNQPVVGGIGGLDIRTPDGGWSVSTTQNTALPSRWIDDVLIADDGDAWFSTPGGGIGVYDGKRWTDYNPNNWGTAPWPFDTDSSTDTVQAADGTIWTAPTNHGVGEWDGTTWRAHLPWYSIESLAIDPKGDVWAAPDRGAVQRWNGNRWVDMTDPTAGADLQQITADSVGNIWLGAANGLYKYDGKKWTRYTPFDSGLPAQYVMSVAAEPSGAAVWVGTEEGLARFDGSEWTVYTEADGLPATVVKSIAFAPGGDVWVGAFDGIHWPYHGGVGHFDGTTWTAYTTANSPLPHNEVEAITVAPDGRVWIGTASEGAAIFTPRG
jgi:ligand-binding sensor domain-containing protein